MRRIPCDQKSLPVGTTILWTKMLIPRFATTDMNEECRYVRMKTPTNTKRQATLSLNCMSLDVR